jgi:HAD superfamily hydrolase (TIGR01549 family)
MHHEPSLKKFYFVELKKLGYSFSEKDVERALINALKKLNKQSQENESFQMERNALLKEFLAALNFKDEDATKLREKLTEAFSEHMRMVIPNSALDLCEELKKRGYRLGIVSNWTYQLGELLRLQGALDLFDSIITAHEVGVAKPHPEIFNAVVEDLDVDAEKCVFVGSSYAADVVGCQRVKMLPILYDPELTELRALEPLDTSSKVVSIENLRKNRSIEGVKVITKFDELLDFCK